GLVSDWLRERLDPAAAQKEPAERIASPRPVSSFAEQVPERHVGAPIARLASDPAHAHRPAVVEMSGPDGERREISWSLLNRRVDDIAAGLLGHGVRPGDRVSILIT